MQPATKLTFIAGRRGGVERTFARGFELCSKVLLGKEDLPKSQLRPTVLPFCNISISSSQSIVS